MPVQLPAPIVTQKLIVYAPPVDRKINRSGTYPLAIQIEDDIDGLINQRIEEEPLDSLPV